jgi:hypothetical protein
LRQGPQDRGRFLAAVLSGAPARVADRGQRRLADRAVAALDGVQPDTAGQVRIALFDTNESHDELLIGRTSRFPLWPAEN